MTGSLTARPFEERRAELLAFLDTETAANHAPGINTCPDLQEWLDDVRARVLAVAANDEPALLAMTQELAPTMDSQWIVSPMLPGRIWSLSATTFFAGYALIAVGSEGFEVRIQERGRRRMPSNLDGVADRGGFATLDEATRWFLSHVQRDDCVIFADANPWSKQETVVRSGGNFELTPRHLFVDYCDMPARLLYAKGDRAVIRNDRPGSDYVVLSGTPDEWERVAAFSTMGDAIAFASTTGV